MFRTKCNGLEPKKVELVGEWRKSRNEKLHYLCCSPKLITLIKSRSLEYTHPKGKY
jgi:hypothetical protein